MRPKSILSFNYFLRSAVNSRLFSKFGLSSRFLPNNVYPDDVFIVSFPKSGNTWLRFLIGNILTNGQCDFNKGRTNERLGAWNTHVLSWLNHSPDDYILVRYEDLKKDTNSEFKKILDFIDLDKNQNEITSAILASDFEKMKSLEQAQSNLYPGFKNTNSAIPFMRTGKSGGWKEYFSAQEEKDFFRYHGEAMQRLNYA